MFLQGKDKYEVLDMLEQDLFNRSMEKYTKIFSEL
jgi:hypothetical protein